MRTLAKPLAVARRPAQLSAGKATRTGWYTRPMQRSLSAVHEQWLDQAQTRFNWLAPGTQIKVNDREFKVVRKLGGGWQAEVFLVNEGKQQRTLKLFTTSERHVQSELAELKSAANGLRVLKDHGIVTGLRFPTRAQPYHGIVFEYVRGLPLDTLLPNAKLPGLDPKVRDTLWKNLEPFRSRIEKVGYKNVLFDLDRGQPVVIDPH